MAYQLCSRLRSAQRHRRRHGHRDRGARGRARLRRERTAGASSSGSRCIPACPARSVSSRRRSILPPSATSPSAGSRRRGSTCTWRRRSASGRRPWSSPCAAGAGSTPTGTGWPGSPDGRAPVRPGGRTPSSVAYCGVSGRPHDSARTADDDPDPRGPGRRIHPARHGRGGRRRVVRHPPPCSPSLPSPIRSPAPHAPRSALRSRGAADGTGRSARRTSRAGRAGSSLAAATSTWPRTCRAPTGTPCTRSATASSSSRAPTPAATAWAALPAAASSSRTPPRRARSSTRCTGTSPG